MSDTGENNEVEIYSVDQVPLTTSWIKGLRKDKMIAQCRAWNLEPAERSEGLREQLHLFVTNNKRLREEEDQAKRPQTVLEKSVEQERTGNDLQGQSNETSGAFSAGLDPNIAKLLESMHHMTLQAVSQTVKQVSQEINKTKTSTADDTNLPPFIRDMLRELSRTDGSNPNVTVDFLKKLTKIIDLGVTSEKAIIVNASAYTTNKLREFWMENVAEGVSWDLLLQNFRENFLVPETLRITQNKFLYRKQGENEDLGDFVREIQILFRILSPFTAEDEVFNIVFRNVNPQTRTTFAGLPPITSLKELIKVAPFSASVRDQTDSQRLSGYRGQFENRNWNQGQRSHSYQNNFQPNRNNFNRRNSQVRPYGSPNNWGGSQQQQPNSNHNAHRGGFSGNNQRLGYRPGYTDNSHFRDNNQSRQEQGNGNRGRK